MVVILGQKYHVGAFFCGTAHLLMVITKLRSDAFGPGYWRLRRQSMHLPIFCRGSCCGSGWCIKASRVPGIPQTDRGITGYLKIVYRKMRKFCQPPRHLGEILLLIVLVAEVDLFE